MGSGKKQRGKRTVSKKISPKRNPKPELKLLFEKIRAKNEAKEAAKLDYKERNVKSCSIPDLDLDLKDKKGSNDKKDKNEKNDKKVENLIKTYESKMIKSDLTGEENALKSQRIKFLKESRVDVMKKTRSPVISNAASPVRKKERKRKLETNIRSVIEKLSTKQNSSPNPGVGEKKSVLNFQRTILDIWGPEVLHSMTKDDH